jgi:iron complex outermembrane recepter protein
MGCGLDACRFGSATVLVGVALVLGILPGFLSPAVADEESLGSGPLVDEIVVQGSRVAGTVLETPAAIGIIDQEEIQLARPQLTLGESLNRIPGVFTQNDQNFAQDLRISIRGFGARARFGLRGVKLIVDGIPATLPDGQGQVDSLQLSTVGRIEVIRGPSSSLYGSAAAGVIRVESEAIGQGTRAATRVGLGDYGYRSYDAKSSMREGSVGILVGLSHQEMGGYRDHSRMENTNLNSRLEWQIDEDSELIGLLSFVDSPMADDPGGLKAAEVAANRRKAAPNNLKFDAGENLKQVTTGMRYRRRSGDQHETTAAAWYGWRDFANRLPIPPSGVSGGLDRTFAGGSIQHEYRDEVFGLSNSLLVGIDVEAQWDDRTRTSAGARTLDQAEDVTSFRVFVRDELSLPEDFTLAFSLGFDNLWYRLDDHLSAGGGMADASGRVDFSEWSPAISFRWNPRKDFNPYLRISTSFEPPTTTEFRNPDGSGFNTDLGAQNAINYEAGVKGLLPGRARYSLALYHIKTSDELIPYEIADETYYRNAGRTERTGFEAMLIIELLDGVQFTAAYTYTSAEFTDYILDGGANLTGNQVPGVPENTFYGELLYMHSSGFFAALEVRGIGAFYANDTNAVRTEAYGVLDYRMGWKAEWGAWRLTPYVSMSNITDTVYNDNVRLNAGFGRYYEPAAGFEIQGGLGIAYSFE